MSFASNLLTFATRVATEFKSIRTLLNGNVSDLSGLTTTDKSTVVAALNEINAKASGAGSGDMQKATYDTNNNGKVDAAELADAVPWAGVTGKPATFPPSDHDAARITSGTIDPARLPPTTGRAPIVSSGGIANLTTPQQNNITEGTTVTTTDGRSWQYSGSGSKTAEASYVEMADKTPEWSVIANKPTTLAGYAITDAQSYHANLAMLAGVTAATDRLFYFTSASTAATAVFTAFGRTLIAAADAAAARTALALGTAATAATGDFAPSSHVGAGGGAHATVTTSVAGFMSAGDKTKLDGIQSGATAYVHPSGDGNLHVPATSTTNNGKVLRAGATAGSISWGLVDWTEIANKPSTFTPTAHTHSISAVTGLQDALDAKANSADIGDPNTNFVTTFNAGLV